MVTPTAIKELQSLAARVEDIADAEARTGTRRTELQEAVQRILQILATEQIRAEARREKTERDRPPRD
jgi:hypothetical protein